MSKESSKKPAPGKVSKPRPDFPLFPHATGRWAKKIRGKTHYFGKVSTDTRGEAALTLWLEQRDELLAGRTPRAKAEGLTIRELADRFMLAKQHSLSSGELSPVSFGDYYGVCQRLLKFFGLSRLVADLTPADFERYRASMSKNWGPTTIKNEIQRLRVVFRYAVENKLISSPVHCGSEFKPPNKKTMRAVRRAAGKRLFEAAELRQLIDAAGVPMRAMILLGINCGLGNSDLAKMPSTALDLDAGWLDYPRPKTEIDRRCPLWPETVAAIQAALACRPKPRSSEYKSLVFLRDGGRPWAETTLRQDNEKKEGRLRMAVFDGISRDFSALLKALGLDRPGLSFYRLRHQFETVGGGARDQIAVNLIMGHDDPTMAANYREEVADDRLRAVVEHVHKWLWPPAPATDAAKDGPGDAAATKGKVAGTEKIE